LNGWSEEAMNGLIIKEVEQFKKLEPPDQRVLLFENVVTVKQDIEKLKSRKWLNTVASAVGGVFGGFFAIIVKLKFWG